MITTEDAVERVADALEREAIRCELSGEGGSEDCWRWEAQAAIEALASGPLPSVILRRALEQLREPTDAMQRAGDWHTMSANAAWRAMVDATIAELVEEDPVPHRSNTAIEAEITFRGRPPALPIDEQEGE